MKPTEAQVEARRKETATASLRKSFDQYEEGKQTRRDASALKKKLRRDALVIERKIRKEKKAKAKVRAKTLRAASVATANRNAEKQRMMKGTERYDRYAERTRMRLYGIDKHQYESMLAKQDGVCAICLRTPQECDRNLSVDHDHSTGAIRGLLCSQCNTSIGLMKDDPVRIERALRYLKGIIS